MQRLFSCAHLSNFGTGPPPRRFAPPLLIRGGEIRGWLRVPNSRRAQCPLLIEEGKFAAGSVSPIRAGLNVPSSSRRGNSRLAPCPQFAPVSMSPPHRGGEIRG